MFKTLFAVTAVACNLMLIAFVSAVDASACAPFGATNGFVKADKRVLDEGSSIEKVKFGVAKTVLNRDKVIIYKQKFKSKSGSFSGSTYYMCIKKTGALRYLTLSGENTAYNHTYGVNKKQPFTVKGNSLMFSDWQVSEGINNDDSSEYINLVNLSTGSRKSVLVPGRGGEDGENFVSLTITDTVMIDSGDILISTMIDKYDRDYDNWQETDLRVLYLSPSASHFKFLGNAKLSVSDLRLKRNQTSKKLVATWKDKTGTKSKINVTDLPNILTPKKNRCSKKVNSSGKTGSVEDFAIYIDSITVDRVLYFDYTSYTDKDSSKKRKEYIGPYLCDFANGKVKSPPTKPCLFPVSESKVHLSTLSGNTVTYTCKPVVSNLESPSCKEFYCPANGTDETYRWNYKTDKVTKVN